MTEAPIREPAVAGRFYPGDPGTLRQAVEDSLDAAAVDPAPERVAGILVPHAGYVYSAQTAAHAFARIRGPRIKRVVLLGCSHHYAIRTASIVTQGAFATPLGDLPIDDGLATAIADIMGNECSEAHGPEHALEVQLPFIAVALGAVSIVPVLFGTPCRAWHAEIGERLAALLNPEDLVLVSTDLSHYLSDAEAQSRDRETLDLFLTGDVERVIRSAHDGRDQDKRCDMCSLAAVVAGMACAKARAADEWSLLDYRSSAAASGDTARVVGYAAVSMERAA